jgi:parvulin-like peptidyl-prolyl isomerase
MALLQTDFNFDLYQDNLIPFLSSQQILSQILREMIIDRALSQIEYKPGDIANLPEDASQTTRIIAQYKMQQFQLKNWGHQLEQYFLQRKRTLDQLVYSIIRTPNPGLTQELYFQAKEQESSFADLARNHSQGPEALTNGIVGPVAVMTLPPQIIQKLVGLQPGGISTPINFQDQWMFMKLESWLPAQFSDRTKQVLLNELFETWLQEQIVHQLPRVAQSQRFNSGS